MPRSSTCPISVYFRNVTVIYTSQAACLGTVDAFINMVRVSLRKAFKQEGCFTLSFFFLMRFSVVSIFIILAIRALGQGQPPPPKHPVVW